ncbi:MAG: FMN-binding protein [Novosphingobium sp.]|nr:FMN-binding protein [Novosphingobium sp.]
MRKFVIALAAAPALLASPAIAVTYLSLPQVQALLFPHQALAPAFRTLTPAQMAAIRKASGEAPLSPELKAWRAADGGWLIVDQVIGKHDFITYAVALDPAGTVRSVEIMDYRESYGGEVRDPRWRAQFVGKHPGQALRAGQEIRTISGATLSSRHVTDGVRRLLATYAIALAHPG